MNSTVHVVTSETELPLELQILQSLRKIIRAIDVHSRKLKTQYRITGPQLSCLGIIQEKGSSTVTKIAKQAFLSTSTVVGILDRLEQEGYILRVRYMEDRRKWNVVLTQQATAFLEVVPTSPHEGLLLALRKLKLDEQIRIAESTLRIVELLEADTMNFTPNLVAKTGAMEK